MNDNISKLYDAMKNRGFNDLGTPDEFSSRLQDEDKRKKAYDALNKYGFNDLGTFDEFSNRVVIKPNASASETQPIATEKSSIASVHTPAPMTEKERQEALSRIQGMKESSQHSMRQFNERMDNMLEYNVNAGLDYGRTAKGSIQSNPQTGNFEQTYITPTGERTFSKEIADFNSSQYRQAADMSIGGQLRKANLHLQKLKDKAEQRRNAVIKDWENKYTAKYEKAKKKGLLSEIGWHFRETLGQQAYPYLSKANVQIESDPEYRALQTAIHQAEEQIGTLNRQKNRENGDIAGFWRGFGDITGSLRTWNFGYSDLMDATTMMHANDKKTQEYKSEDAMNAEQEMLQSTYENQQTQQAYGENDNFWYRAGVMTGHMVPFMIDFALTGGGFEGIKIFGKGGSKLATKAIGEEVVKEMAEQGFKTYVKNNGIKGFGKEAANWTIKALGTTADDLLIRAPLMTNTIQSGKTASDIIDRKLGDVIIDENGNYNFSNHESWGSAIWQGEANTILENYSEMFGAHLPDLGVRKIAETFGGKRLSGLLSRADNSSFGKILDTTKKQLEKFGISDYFGEVTEEYYGQLWRTMLNLDDAFQNGYKLDDKGKVMLDEQGQPIIERTNLLRSGQFHGDIWGGLALSMGLMGAGRYTVSAAGYGNMKHQVNKADKTATEILSAEIWEPLRETIDNTTNEDIGNLISSLLNDSEFSEKEKEAAMGYVWNSMQLRGFNLGTIAEQRGNEQSEEEQALNESYLDGYDASSPQEMNDAKNMYEYQRKRAIEAFGEELANLVDGNPVQQLLEMKNSGMYGENELTIIQDYANAKTLYNGMMQGVRDRIDDQVAQSNSIIDSRTNPDTGTIQTATMKQDDRKVYIIGGNLATFDDGTIDREHSDESLILIDAETGKKEFADPHSILSADSPINAEQQKQEAQEAIRLQYAQEAASNIDGILPMNAGDTYTVSLDGENIIEATVVGPAIEENGMPIPEMFLVDINGEQQTLSREEIQSASEAASLQRLNNFETERAIENEQSGQLQQKTAYEESRPEYVLNDIVTLKAEDGSPVRGSITAEMNEDGQIEVYTEQPINGKRINLFTPDELDALLIDKNGEDIVIVPPTPAVNEVVEEIPQNTEAIEETVPEAAEEEQPQLSALERIPTDEKGKPIFIEVDAETAWDGLVEKTQDEATAQSFADNMVASKEAALKKAEKAKTKTTDDIDEFVEAENMRKALINEAKAELEHWKNIARTNKRRQEEAEAIRREEAKRISEENRIKSEQERLEREEAERIEREALNGVPDWVKDTPQDARARGYRRFNSAKIDRQEPISSVKGKEVEVKFGEKDMPKGHVTVIEASQLQPSHSQGKRNPAFFLDEAQPKDRKDDVSIISAQRIAENIRPEEITSSITAYTGAPSVNSRGETIQGNNRSDALKFMYDANKESAEKYKSYLIDHAEEFGLSADAISAMKNPVLVNMLDVDDNEAIRLGQFVAQDTESGGIERIKAKNAIQKMGDKIHSFANILLASNDEEMSFSELVDKNGVKTLQWMNQTGIISSTHYASAIDDKGNITGEAVNDLKSILYQSIFSGGSTSLEDMFNRMPAKAQKAILATAFRDYDSPNVERMVHELQQSIIAYSELSTYEPFAKAKNIEEVLRAVEAWKRQLTFDDVSGESYLPAEKFSNFALYLAAIYKGQTQKFIQQTFNDLYDVVQGTQEDTLFEEADKTPKPLAEAIRQVLDIEYQPIIQNDNGTNGSTDVALDSKEGAGERSRSNGDAPSREQDSDGAEQTDNRGRTEESGTGRTTTVTEEIAAAEAETDTNPTEAQKEAGNYKKGHVKIHGFDISIEQPKGSVRSGVDPNGTSWSVIMNNTYGYIRRTKSRDNEQIDVFVGPNPKSQRVFVVDQVNADSSFDEHKVLIGFDSIEEAQEAYLSNYEEGWQGLGNITETDIDSFREWADVDGRRIKPFADYSMNQKTESDNESTKDNTGEFSSNNNSILKETQLSLFTPDATQGQIDWQHDTDHVSRMEVTEEIKKEREKVGYTTEDTGDITYTERQLTEQGHLTFMGAPLTGAAKIKSSDDIAFLFKNLESAATENSFLVMIRKDGSYGVYYSSTGAVSETVVDMKLFVAAAKEFEAVKVCFVHNHPSGSLVPSSADISQHGKLKKSMSLIGVKTMDSVIINLDSGQYLNFTENNSEKGDKKKAPKKIITPKVLAFDRQKLYVPSTERVQIRTSSDVAEFLSQQKRGSIPKLQVIICDRQMKVAKYMFIDPNLTEDEIQSILAYEAGKHGEAVFLASNGVLNSESIKRMQHFLKNADIRLLDALEVKQDEGIIESYKSFADEGVLESEEKYNKKSKNNTNFASNESTRKADTESDSTVPIGSTSEELRGVHGVHSQYQSFRDRLGERIAQAEREREKPLSLHERQDEENRFALEYAKENNVWIDDFLSLGNRTLSGGNENTLVVDEKNVIVYKSNNLINSKGLISELLDSVESHNRIFPETHYEFVGFTGIDIPQRPYIEVILSQKYIPNSVQATHRDIGSYMDSLGFEKVNDSTFTDNEYIVSDLHPRNVLKDENGNIYVIDDIIRPVPTIDNTVEKKDKDLEPPEIRVGEDLFEYAKRVTDWNENKVSNNEEEEAGNQSTTETPTRDANFTERDRVIARRSYENMVSSGAYQFQEAVQDSMLGLKKLYQAILGKNTNIADVPGFENAYLAENRMSSVNAAEQQDYYGRFMRPLLEEIGKICGTDASKRQALEDYMMAKHGLERNQVLAERDAKENEKDVSEYRTRDYAGLTALTGMEEVAEAEAIAEQMVSDYESKHNTDTLWQMVNAATGATLAKIYSGGLLSKEKYEEISHMYKHYIPLQGFNEKTSDEVYGYMTSNQSPLIGAPIKRAEGRKSKADDPVATIAMMADTAIMKSNRNLMKQKFLNFVLNHPSDLVSVNDLWLQYDEISGEWKPIFPEISTNDSASEVDQKVADFEGKMKELSESDDKYKRGKDIPTIPYRVINGNLSEHQVLVKRGGSTYVLTINGNPRAAQAINGLTNPDVDQSGIVGNMLKAGEYVNRQLSAFYTTRNPDFVVSNFLRDAVYSNCMTWVRESPNYALRFHKNFGKMNPVTLYKLLKKWEDGNLDTNNNIERLFSQFILNGGVTGYTSVKDIDSQKKTIEKELKNNQGNIGRKVWNALGMQFDLLNSSVENCARFAAFVTSREMGRTIDRSIWDAKEVSVNFNKKGSGGKMVNATGQTKIGKLGSYIGGGGRLLYVFWNAGVQGMTNFFRAAKDHPGKAVGEMAALFSLGAIVPLLAQLMGGGDGDDDDKNAYYNLPEYIRRSNICFRIGENWLTIPLPIEFRSFYGLGELGTGVITGNERLSNSELGYEIASQVSQMLPLDMLEGGGGVAPFIPSAAKPFTEAYIMNKSWTGLPIYKDTPFNKNDPEWTKAYKNADKTILGITRWLNEKTGGDDFKKGSIDINPAKIEYLLSGTFGGYVSTAEKLKKMGETAIGEREFDWRNMLLANRVVKQGNERTAYRKLQNEYYKYKEEYEETKRLLNKYENAADDGILGMAEKADFLYNSKEYLRYELFDEYVDDIKTYREDIADSIDNEEKKMLEQEMYDTMRELINQLHETDKRK